ncbi:MAG: hypothetical protein RR719_01410, partial [Akkermansia sp.]
LYRKIEKVINVVSSENKLSLIINALWFFTSEVRKTTSLSLLFFILFITFFDFGIPTIRTLAEPLKF